MLEMLDVFAAYTLSYRTRRQVCKYMYLHRPIAPCGELVKGEGQRRKYLSSTPLLRVIGGGSESGYPDGMSECAHLMDYLCTT